MIINEWVILNCQFAKFEKMYDVLCITPQVCQWRRFDCTKTWVRFRDEIYSNGWFICKQHIPTPKEALSHLPLPPVVDRRLHHVIDSLITRIFKMWWAYSSRRMRGFTKGASFTRPRQGDPSLFFPSLSSVSLPPFSHFCLSQSIFTPVTVFKFDLLSF